MSSRELSVRRRTLFMFDRDFIRASWAAASLGSYAQSCQAWEEHIEDLLTKSFDTKEDVAVCRTAQSQLETLHELLLPLSVTFYERAEARALEEWGQSAASSGMASAIHLRGGCSRLDESTGERFSSSWSIAGKMD